MPRAGYSARRDALLTPAKGLGSTGLTFKRSATRPAFDKPAAVAFIATVPRGWCTTYSDVADAAGMGHAQAGALRVGQWIADEIEPGSVPRAYAVLKSDGRVDPKYRSAAPGMPATPKEAQARLESDGLTFGDGRADDLRRWTVEHMRELRR